MKWRAAVSARFVDLFNREGPIPDNDKLVLFDCSRRKVLTDMAKPRQATLQQREELVLPTRW